MNSRREQIHRSGLKNKNNFMFSYQSRKFNFSNYHSTSQTYVERGTEKWLDIPKVRFIDSELYATLAVSGLLLLLVVGLLVIRKREVKHSMYMKAKEFDDNK